jgi:hypothetical protein
MADIAKVKRNITKMIDQGAEESEIDSYVASEGVSLDQLQAPTRQSQMMAPDRSLWSGGAQFGSGMMQGMGDELKAVGAAAKESLSGGLDFGEAYSQALPQYQRARSAYEEDNPILAPTLDIAGQAAPWLMTAGLIPPVAQGASMGQKMVYGAKVGAPIGAASGGLNAEGDMYDRAVGAGAGTALGGVLGGATPPIVEGVIGAGKGLINQLVSRMPYKQREMASRKIAEALARDGLTPESAALKLQEMGPSASILDLGPNTRALGGSAVQTPGSGKTKITDFLVGRQEGIRDSNKVIQGGQINRITEQMRNLVPENYAATQAEIDAGRRSFGKSYNVARDGGDLVDIEPLLKGLSDDIAESKGGIKSGLEKVKAYLVDEKGNPEVTIDTLHQAKMAIDDLMSGEARMSMGNVAKGKIRDYQNALLDAIESSGESGAAYKAGRVGTRGEWMKQEALEMGAKLMSKSEFSNPEQMKAALAKMSPEELHTFRIGAVQALKQKVSDLVSRADATKKIMDVPALEQKIRMAFGDDELFKKYITSLESEKEMFKSYATMGGSQTAEREAAKADAVVDPSRIIQGLTKLKSPNPLSWLGGAIDIAGGAKDRVMMPEGLSRNLAEALTGRDISALKKAFKSGKISDENKIKMIRALSSASGSYSGTTDGYGQNRTINDALLGAR